VAPGAPAPALAMYLSMPPRLPVPADRLVGLVVHVPAGMARYRTDPTIIRIKAVRVDISIWYDGDWVWIEGDELDQGERVLRSAQLLVHVGVFAEVPPGPRR
jgi:hypothetical protein